MPKVSPEILAAVKVALKSYIDEIESKSNPMRDTSKGTYCRHASHFVRWLDDDFEPGARLRG